MVNTPKKHTQACSDFYDRHAYGMAYVCTCDSYHYTGWQPMSAMRQLTPADECSYRVLIITDGGEVVCATWHGWNHDNSKALWFADTEYYCKPIAWMEIPPAATGDQFK